MIKKALNNKILLSIIIFISTLLIASGGYIGITKYIDYKAKIAVEEINKTLEHKISKEYSEKYLTEKLKVNNFLGIILKNPVSLYMDKNLPKLELIKYNLENKNFTKLKICRISNESYAKIEILRGRKDNLAEKKEFFTNGIDKIKTFKCFEKKINFNNSPLLSSGEGVGGGGLLIKKEINLKKYLGNPARSGLYYVTFADKKDRIINNNLQYPIFFGIIDSHITMKISKNGKGFFFVNDFEGKPLANQEIRVYINKFQDHQTSWNRVKRKEEIKYFSPLDKLVLGKEIYLGKTNSQGILEVDLKGKVDGAFQKTFSNWNYKYNGIDDSFFITSASKEYLTYNHSRWNSGIAPWNFGYDFEPQRWGREEPKFYSHIYTDRKLYLPGEEVNIKAIIRNSENLKIPKNKEFRFIVKDSNNKEILNSKLKLSEFGSIYEKIKLTKNSPTGTYFITLKDKNGDYGYSNFSVEVFKNPTFKTDVEDNLGEKISSSNSIIAKHPSHLKRGNYNAGIKFETKNKFYKKGENIKIKGGLSKGKWTSDYDNKYLFVIKKKNYSTKYINDVRGYKRPINSVGEKIEKILLVNSKNFKINSDGKLEFNYNLKETGEYVFEYGKIDFSILNKENIKINSLSTDGFSHLKENNKGLKPSVDSYINDLEYFTLLSYGDINAQNPIASDNKIRVLSQKTSYKLGEKAKILIRLPFKKGKILWTVEKQGVMKKEYIDVNSNIFFKEVLVDDTFIPNAYIGVVAIETPPLTPPYKGGESKAVVPEYKVGYTEIVVDKNAKKSNIEIKTDKKVYKPREKVVLQIKNTVPVPGIKKGSLGTGTIGKKAELTVMVVDDSLISLMGNVDLNTLEKFYKKLPFQIQTSITNLAMLKNYYFSRPGIVGGSGFGNFKGGDSAVNSRTIFKNTAYYNPSVITDNYGNAKVEFELPDNLTNFRIMVIANSSDNFFGYSSQNIEVRKNVVIEDKTPLIYRAGDKIEIGAKIFNNTDKKIGFQIKFDSSDIEVEDPTRKVFIKPNSSQLLHFWTKGNLDSSRDIKYTISALGDSIDNSDKFEKVLENKEFPSLNTTIVKGGLAEKNIKQHFKIQIPENTDLKKSKVKISFSNNLLQGIDKTVKSLLVYPYGCIEQTTSSTYPNAIILNFSKIFPGIIPEEKAKKNLEEGIKRIEQMQVSSGGFAYWIGDSQADLHITPYVLRRLIDMKKFGVKVPENMIKKASKYLENNLGNIKENIDKAETFYTFTKLGKSEFAYNKLLKGLDKSKLTRHELIAYTYGLITWDKKENKEVIDRNITRIINKLNNNENQARYWSKLSDKALFTSMLIDYGYDEKIITKYIQELYNNDWSNYYYSTTAKNNAFVAFSKYIKKYGSNSSSNFAFSIGYIQNRDKRFWLGGKQPNTIKREFLLDDVVQYKEDFIELTTYVLSGKNIFTNLTLEAVPKDKLKIKETSNKMKVSRNIYEQESGKEIVDGIYERGKLYNIKIKIKFDEDKNRRNVALEDYIPSSFKIINTKFKTEAIIAGESNINKYKWNHIEYLKDRVFATAKYTWGNELNFEYTVRPEFRGEFTYPPVNAYMMYDGEINSHSKFEKIKVK